MAEPKAGGGENQLAVQPIIDGVPRPEILSAREMLAVGNPFIRLPELAR